MMATHNDFEINRVSGIKTTEDQNKSIFILLSKNRCVRMFFISFVMKENINNIVVFL